ncbi:hypothetical protein HKBW3S42_00816 [Candidatus Hakubella thermalkaliphila]|uniref:Uncharacterized protein n=1 Tax=Candidatus Hakubella thermalkaliphila TaxID=2754717 RepID=A0A6V8PIK9_9ACTN|nr:hypothetical protein HKBW3S42_00816 [Candidatus Hakubella thermalkaliphila]
MKRSLKFSLKEGNADKILALEKLDAEYINLHFPPLHAAFRYFFLTRGINSGISGYVLVCA